MDYPLNFNPTTDNNNKEGNQKSWLHWWTSEEQLNN